MFASKFYQAIVRKATEIVISSLKVALTTPLPHIGDSYLHHRTTELLKVTSYFGCVLSTAPSNIINCTISSLHNFIYEPSRDKILQGFSAEAQEKQDLKIDN